MRADLLLLDRGLAATRSQAQRLIAGGVEWLQGEAWKRVVKNGDEVPDDAQLRLLDDAVAGGGDGDFAGAALEQLHAEFVLQLLDGDRKRRLADPA